MIKDLKEKVLTASLELIQTQGLGALSMREVARRAGVSHQAPYHHFADKESIVAELVRRGFAILADRMEATASTAPTAKRLYGVGRDYVEFALEQPGYFQLMFRSELLDLNRFPKAQAESDRAFGILQRLVFDRYETAPELREAIVTLHWSLVHGMASLFLEGDLGQRYPSLEKKKSHLQEVLEAFDSIRQQAETSTTC